MPARRLVISIDGEIGRMVTRHNREAGKLSTATTHAFHPRMEDMVSPIQLAHMMFESWCWLSSSFAEHGPSTLKTTFNSFN